MAREEEKGPRLVRRRGPMVKVDIKPFELSWQTVGRTVLIVTQGKDGKPNPMTAGWLQLGGLWGLPIITIAVRPERYTYKLLEECPEFTLNVPGKNLKDAVAVCGKKSGRDMDKFAVCGMTATPGRKISVPSIEEARIVYECKVVLTAQSEPITTHRLYFGEILAAYADAKLVTKTGKERGRGRTVR